MTVCAVNGCHNASNKINKSSNITFHTFPADPIVAAHWIERIRLNRNISYWKPSKNSKICSIHFDDKEKYITKGGLCRLHRGAVPTKDVFIFCDPREREKIMDSHPQNQSKPDVPISCTSIKQEKIMDCHLPNQSESDVPILWVPVKEEKLGDCSPPNQSQSDASILWSPVKEEKFVDCDLPSQSQPGKAAGECSDPEGSEATIEDFHGKSRNSQIFHTPREDLLRRELKRKMLHQKINSRNLKTLQQKTRRLEKRSVALQKLVVTSQKGKCIDNAIISNVLSKNVLAAELYNSLIKKRNKKRDMPKYTPEFKHFCLTLHFCSPRAYAFMRKTFGTVCLPHPKTISHWYRTSNGAPGLTEANEEL